MSVLKAKTPSMNCRMKLYPSVKSQSTSVVDWLPQLTFPPSIAIALLVCPDCILEGVPASALFRTTFVWWRNGWRWRGTFPTPSTAGPATPAISLLSKTLVELKKWLCGRNSLLTFCYEAQVTRTLPHHTHTRTHKHTYTHTRTHTHVHTHTRIHTHILMHNMIIH